METKWFSLNQNFNLTNMCVNCRTPMSLKRTCRRETGDMETLTDAADTDRRHGETLTDAADTDTDRRHGQTLTDAADTDRRHGQTLTDAADTDRRHGETPTNAERPVPEVEGGDETHAGHLLPQLWVVGVVGGQRDGVVAAQ